MFKNKSLQINLNSQIDLTKLSDDELRDKYKELDKTLNSETVLSVFSVAKEAIKRIYAHCIEDKDVQVLNKFLNGATLNINNYNDIFYPFLIYLLIVNHYNFKTTVLYINRFLMFEHISEIKKMFAFLNLSFGANLTSEKCVKIEISFKSKAEIYSSNIIFSTYEELLFDYVMDLTNKVKNTENIFQNVFIFDIDRILSDFEKCNFKVIGVELSQNSVKIKEFFKKFKTIQGVSQALFFERASFARKYGLKIDNTQNRKEIFNYLKNANDVFCINSDKKVIEILHKIEEGVKENYSIVVCIENYEELLILQEYLKIKKIDFSKIANDTLPNIKDVIKILKKSKVTLISNFIAPFVKPELVNKKDNDFKIDMSTYAYNLDINDIQEESKVKLIFASHYIEFKNEYLVINNYFEKIASNMDIFFFNAPDDELFKRFYLDRLNLIEKRNTEKSERKYKIISKFLYLLRKFYSLKIKNEDSCLIYHFDENIKNACHILKIAKDDYCYCQSGLKYKNCCGKEDK